MQRREFITLLGGAAVGWPLAAGAQQSERMHRVGVLMLYVENDPEGQLRAQVFQQGLEKLGWIIGRNLRIDYHWGVGDGNWIQSAAAELLTRAPDVILANGGPAVRAVQQSTHTVSTVFIGGADPVADGFVQSLARPGGNFTGFTTLETSVGAKLLELLKEVAPGVTRVAVLINPDNPGSLRLAQSAASAAQKLGADVVAAPVRRVGGDRGDHQEVGERAGCRSDRPPGSLHELAPPIDRRIGGTLSHPRSMHCAQRPPRAA